MNNMFDMSFMGSGNAQSSSASPSSVGMTSTFDQFGANPPVVGMGSTFDQFGFVGGLEGIGGTGASMFAPLTIPSHTTASTDSLQSSTIMSSVNALPCSANKVDYSKHYVEYSSPTGAVTDSGDASQSGEGQVNVDSNEQSNAVCDASAETSSPVEAPIIDIIINNVVCSFSTRCHLNLKKIAREGMHVIYKPENGLVSMKLRKPYTTANIWSSGNITATGATSEADAKIAARRYCRILQKMGFRVKFARYRVVNVLGTCSLPFGIRINQFARDHHKQCSYEPELHPGATYTLKEPRATLKLFTTGSITVTAPQVENVQLAIQHIWPLVYKYRMENESLTAEEVSKTQMFVMPGNNTRVSLYNKKRRKAIRSRCAKFLDEDSDGENWSDSSENCESEEPGIDEEEEEEQY